VRISWLVATTIGSALGAVGALAAGAVAGDLISTIALGTILGGAQWLVLRRRVETASRWVPVTALGTALGFAIASEIHRTALVIDAPVVVGTIGLAAVGAAVGLTQSLVARPCVSAMGRWVLASTVGWAAGGFAVWSLALRLPEPTKLIVDFVVVGLFTGAVGQWALVVPLKRPTDSAAGATRSQLAAAVALVATLVALVVAGERVRNGGGIPSVAPDLVPTLSCSAEPPLRCGGGGVFCGELVPFEPVAGAGYVNDPVNGESAADQYRSYLAREVVTMIKYAVARVDCESASWGYGPDLALALGDMSESDGSIPGTSVGRPAHPAGTHEGGRDIDVAHYQIDAGVFPRGDKAHRLRPVCVHARLGMEVNHCTDVPHLLDPWRTALLIARLADHPRLRVVGVDGEVGPLVEESLDQLVVAGWIDPELRQRIPLAYETTDSGRGWFRHHHHHIHISASVSDGE